MWHTGVDSCSSGRSSQISIVAGGGVGGDLSSSDVNPAAGGLQLDRLAPAAERKPRGRWMVSTAGLGACALQSQTERGLLCNV